MPHNTMKKRNCWWLWIFLIAFGAAQPQQFDKPPVLFKEPLSPRIANYDIDVRLDPQTKMIQGKQLLTWKNTTANETAELQFHLYLNGFRNNRSTFMIESGGRHRGNKIDRQGWGFIEINQMTLLPAASSDAVPNYIQLPNPETRLEVPGEDLTADMGFIQPDNPEHIHDKTVLRVPLPRAVKPGESVSVYVDFTAKLPEPPFARTGAKEEYFFVGQWFPKVGVLEEDGWNCHQFHLNSEFFADYGVYNVWITVPQANIVGATGLQVGQPLVNDDGSATHYYHAEDVHDFAWTTSPVYLEFKGKAQDVEIRALVQPDHREQGARHVEAARVAIEYFQNWYGDYPYPNLTVIDPRRGAEGSGGMEYPTLITAGTSYGMPEGVRLPEMVIIHEFGHNYWYHLLASNEFEESWLDEGINTYTEIQIMNDQYGPRGDFIDFLGVQVNDREYQRLVYLLLPDADPMLRNAWDYYSNMSYAINSYARPGLVLSTLHNYLGQEKMLEVMRAYVARWRFKHPTSRDFINTASDVVGEDLSWFFDQALYGNGVLDYSVDRVFTRVYEPDRGVDFDYNPAEFVHPAHAGESPPGMEDSLADSLAEITPVDSSDADAVKRYYSGVNLRRLGEFKFPVELRVEFEDGEVIRETWDGKDLWKKFRYLKPARLVSASVDPDNKVVMDANFTNNSKVVEPAAAGINKLSVRWLFWMQFLLDQPEFLNLFSFFL